MKIKYEFTNETVEIEVDEEWGNILVDLNRQEYNINYKETRRHYSLDACQFEGADFAVENEELDALFAEPTAAERLHTAISKPKLVPSRSGKLKDKKNPSFGKEECDET